MRPSQKAWSTIRCIKTGRIERRDVEVAVGQIARSAIRCIKTKCHREARRHA